MRAYRSAPVVVVLLSMLALVAPSNAETPKAYLIHMQLTTTTPNGGKQVIQRPCLMTLEGHEACIHVGETLSPPEGVKVQEPLHSGLHVRVKLFPNRGQLFVDATLNKSSGQSDADGVSIGTTSARILKAITLGKKMTVPISSGNDCWELLVEEASDKNLAAIGAKGIPAGSGPVAAAAPTPAVSAWRSDADVHSPPDAATTAERADSSRR